MFVKHAITGCVSLMLIGGSAWSDAVPTGFLEGHLKIFPLGDANLGDDGRMPAPVSEAPYSEYPLVVLAGDGKKEITHVMPDRNGNYRVELPEGEYLLKVDARTRKRGKPRPFKVVSNQTVRVDMTIDTGIR